MTKNYSALSKLGYIAIIVACVWFLAQLAYGWSINQTEVFTGAITGIQFSGELAWIIQLGPQALFVIAAMALGQKQNKLAWACILGGFTLNFLDAFTNIVTFQELWPEFSAALAATGRSAQFVSMTYPVGLVVAFSVTWAEEGIMLMVATALGLFVEFADDMRWRLPKQFRNFVESAKKGAKAASGDVRKQTNPGSHHQPHGGMGSGYATPMMPPRQAMPPNQQQQQGQWRN